MNQQVRTWFESRESPVRGAARTARAFPPGCGRALAERLRVPEGGRVGVVQDPGELLACRLAAAERVRGVVLLEPDPRADSSPVPPSLTGSAEPTVLRADPAGAPLAPGSLDALLMGDLRGVVGRWEGPGPLAVSLRDALVPDASLIGLLPLEERTWKPASFRAPGEEQQRKADLRTLEEAAHETIGTARAMGPAALLEAFRAALEDGMSVGGWFEPFRLENPGWSDTQRSDLIDLVHHGCRDRLRALRELAREADLWSADHGRLFRRVAADCQQRSLRRRKALEGGRKSDGSARPFLVLRGIPADSS